MNICCTFWIVFGIVFYCRMTQSFVIFGSNPHYQSSFNIELKEEYQFKMTDGEVVALKRHSTFLENGKTLFIRLFSSIPRRSFRSMCNITMTLHTVFPVKDFILLSVQKLCLDVCLRPRNEQVVDAVARACETPSIEESSPRSIEPVLKVSTITTTLYC